MLFTYILKKEFQHHFRSIIKIKLYFIRGCRGLSPASTKAPQSCSLSPAPPGLVG